MDCVAWAYDPGNPNGWSRTAANRFRHLVVKGGPFDENAVQFAHKEQNGGSNFPGGRGYSDPSSSDLNIYMGSATKGLDYTAYAYVRLQVTGKATITLSSGRKVNRNDVVDDWFISNTLTFTHKQRYNLSHKS